MEASTSVLSGAVQARRAEAVEGSLTLSQAAGIVSAWSLVHGFSMLLLDGRLKHILAKLPEGSDADALLGEIFKAVQRPG